MFTGAIVRGTPTGAGASFSATSWFYLSLMPLIRASAHPRLKLFFQKLPSATASFGWKAHPPQFSAEVVAAVMNEVDAVVRRIAKPMLMSDDLSTIVEDMARKLHHVFKARRHTRRRLCRPCRCAWQTGASAPVVLLKFGVRWPASHAHHRHGHHFDGSLSWFSTCGFRPTSSLSVAVLDVAMPSRASGPRSFSTAATGSAAAVVEGRRRSTQCYVTLAFGPRCFFISSWRAVFVLTLATVAIAASGSQRRGNDRNADKYCL